MGDAGGLSEFGGGALTVLGLGGPPGPISTLGSMGMATATVHRGKQIWATSGGAELPVLNMAVASALTPCGTLGGIAFGLATRQQPTAQEHPEAPADEPGSESEVPAAEPVAHDGYQELPQVA